MIFPVCHFTVQLANSMYTDLRNIWTPMKWRNTEPHANSLIYQSSPSKTLVQILCNSVPPWLPLYGRKKKSPQNLWNFTSNSGKLARELGAASRWKQVILTQPHKWVKIEPEKAEDGSCQGLIDSCKVHLLLQLGREIGIVEVVTVHQVLQEDVDQTWQGKWETQVEAVEGLMKCSSSVRTPALTKLSGEPQSSFQVLAHEAKPVGKNSQLPFHSAGKEGLRVA